MLLKHKHLLDELRAKDRKATAEILSMTTLGEAADIKATFAPDEDLSLTKHAAKGFQPPV